MDECIFCRIVAGELPAYKVWENQGYLAFLDIFPKIRGQVVLVSKKHYPSYLFVLPENVQQEFWSAARQVALKMDEFLKVERTALRMEGLELDHAHLKLYPVYSPEAYSKDANRAPSRMPEKDLVKIAELFRKGGDI